MVLKKDLSLNNSKNLFLFLILCVLFWNCQNKYTSCFNISEKIERLICFENNKLVIDTSYSDSIQRIDVLLLFDSSDSLLIEVLFTHGRSSIDVNFNQQIKDSWTRKSVGPVNNGVVNILVHDMGTSNCLEYEKTIFSRKNISAETVYEMSLDFLKDDYLLSVSYYLISRNRNYNYEEFMYIIDKNDFECDFISCFN